MNNSLDPRVSRLPEIGEIGKIIAKAPLDQFGTFEVFVQPKTGKPFQHEGIVHAPNLELAYLLAKETFTRRFTCTSLYIVDTRDVYVSALTEANQNVYDLIEERTGTAETTANYEIYHLSKRGKQHICAGTISASSVEHAMSLAKDQFKNEKLVFNSWVIPSHKVRYSSKEEEEDLWLTLPEKKFRDAAEYKGGEKLKLFLAKQR